MQWAQAALVADLGAVVAAQALRGQVLRQHPGLAATERQTLAVAVAVDLQPVALAVLGL